ncbi:MAG: hypothetical protein DRP68_02850 [Candidatus Omnitrophota bacterium]|nr:MAG: hypothetical protein DRP68_02850 [Candidatus Omnitrophota bacterium]RKY45678.1 MAG: hypothetical protein DRP81_03150 [Candidatus Omnitrophota bacterium]HDN86263.1 MerR family transcriptional regulator [Candidatus Omnitrophota bacterium]
MEGQNKKLISAKEIAKKFNIPYSTVNHYTNLGFLSVVKRKGNMRFYEETKVKERLKRILHLKDEGYPLRLIFKMLNGR